MQENPSFKELANQIWRPNQIIKRRICWRRRRRRVRAWTRTYVVMTGIHLVVANLAAGDSSTRLSFNKQTNWWNRSGSFLTSSTTHGGNHALYICSCSCCISIDHCTTSYRFFFPHTPKKTQSQNPKPKNSSSSSSSSSSSLKLQSSSDPAVPTYSNLFSLMIFSLSCSLPSWSVPQLAS